MPVYYPPWAKETLVLERVLEIKGSSPVDDAPLHFRIEVFLSEASDLYFARCFKHQQGRGGDMWGLEGESSGHGEADDAVQHFLNKIDVGLPKY